MMRVYSAFIITDIPGMTHRERDWARRFITFIDAVYESHAKLVLTSAVPLSQLFLGKTELDESLDKLSAKKDGHTTDDEKKAAAHVEKMTDATHHNNEDHHADVDDVMRNLMDDLGMSMAMLKQSNMFSGDEERFAFARALSRLTEMGSQEWVERGLGMEKRGGLQENQEWGRVRSRWREDML
jgi:protein AFG1